MRLKRLTLINFQGIRKLCYEFPDGDAVIVGPNEAGKTTIGNAIIWTMTGKPLTGEVNYTPKTISGNEPMHKADHTAELVLELENRRVMNLEKTYREVWTKKRGSAMDEFTGHETVYKIDGVPTTAREYEDTIRRIAGTPEQILQLTVPAYFSETMSWQDRRKLIIDMCGDVSDEDVIRSAPDLKALPTIARTAEDGSIDVETTLKVAQATRQEINQEIKSIPARIDELTRMMPETMTGKQIEALRAETDSLRAQIDDLTRAIAEAESRSADQQSRAAIAELQTKYAEAKAAHAARENEVHNQCHTGISEMRRIYRAIEIRFDTAKATQRKASAELDRLIGVRSDVTERWRTIKESEWRGEAACPTCKRDYDATQIEEARALFNLDKSRKLEAIIEEGKQTASADIIKAATEALDEATSDVARIEADLEAQSIRISEAIASVPMSVKFEETDIAASLKQRIEDLRQAEAANHDTVAQTGGMIEERDTLRATLKACEDRLAEQERISSIQARVNKLSDEERDLAAAFEEQERITAMCELFIRRKTDMLTEGINRQFKTLRLKLFETQVNGGIKPTCEVLIPSEAGTMVPFKSANNAGRINAGLEIIDRLTKHYGFSMPVVIDNADLINTFTETPRLQKIRLEVGAKGTNLTLLSAAEFDKIKAQYRDSVAERIAIAGDTHKSA